MIPGRRKTKARFWGHNGSGSFLSWECLFLYDLGHSMARGFFFFPWTWVVRSSFAKRKESKAWEIQEIEMIGGSVMFHYWERPPPEGTD